MVEKIHLFENYHDPTNFFRPSIRTLLVIMIYILSWLTPLYLLESIHQVSSHCFWKKIFQGFCVSLYSMYWKTSILNLHIWDSIKLRCISTVKFSFKFTSNFTYEHVSTQIWLFGHIVKHVWWIHWELYRCLDCNICF
jgi:hypothetical protein